ncbi:MAG: enoyl-CoA hydratase/isomerase family protein [Beijerinckiaceae bacterium]
MRDTEVICEKMGRCGVITLNRPKALNSLTLTMVREMTRALVGWEEDADILSVVVRGAGDRAFCAGGDVKQLYELGKAGAHAEQLAFMREEYQLDYRIKTYPKPYVALMDGIVMGGGAGVGIHAHHRVAGEKFSFAMPEVGIGYFPDIGASYFLPRLVGRIGTYLALTGARVGLGDALAVGLVDAHVPAVEFEALLVRLVSGQEVAAAIAAEAIPAPAPTLAAEKHCIDECFDGQSVAAILGKLAEASVAGSPFAAKTRENILAKSPTSVAIALKQMQFGAKLDLAETLRMDLRIVARIAQGHDFYEGVRATMIDRDNASRWMRETVEAVEPADIDAYFARLVEGELELPSRVSAP